MKITAIHAIPYAIPYERAVRFASGEVVAATDVLIEIVTDVGLVGVAEALPRPYTYGESQRSIVSAVREWFEPWLCGIDPFRRNRIKEILARVRGNNSVKGAIDVAVWDLIGQATDTSVSSLLGGYRDEIAVAHMVGLDSPDVMLEDALAMRSEHGINTFKIKVGRDVETDVAAVIALREGLGAGSVLYLDGNQGWNADQTIDAMRQLDGVGIRMLEEPNPANARLERERVVRAVGVPIVGDESCPTIGEAAQHLTSGTADMVSIKTCRTGFSESQRILSLVEGLGAGTVVGSQVDGALGAVASAQFAAAYPATCNFPAEVANYLNIKDHLVAEPPEISDGRMRLPKGPGLGVTVDPELLAHYRTDC